MLLPAQTKPWIAAFHLQLLFWIGGYGFAKCSKQAGRPGSFYTYYPRFIAYSALSSVTLSVGQLPWYIYAICYGAVPLIGSAFFTWDYKIPGCAWSIDAGGCRRLCKDPPVIIGLTFLSLLFASMLGYSLWRTVVVEQWPWYDLASLGAAWLFPPALYALLKWRGAPSPDYHFHHYAIGYWLLFLLPFDTLEAHLVRGFACGVFAQGSFIAAMGPMLFPPRTSTLFSKTSIRTAARSRRTARFLKDWADKSKRSGNGEAKDSSAVDMKRDAML